MNIHLFTHLAMAIFVLVGILIPIHDFIHNKVNLYFENRATYRKRARVIYRAILFFILIGVGLYTLHPIITKAMNLYPHQFVNTMLVGFCNIMIIGASVVFGGFIGSKIVKLFN